MPDHIHICCTLPRTISLSHYVEEIKRSSSKWMKTQEDNYLNFTWQRGYAAFSVSPSVKENVIKYITNQKKQHRKMSFKDELLIHLDRHNIKYDTKYLWD